jgi:predicted dienelactone hydrolase
VRAGFDYVNHPADVSFLIDSVLALDADADDPLSGHVDREHIAAGGISLGAVTTLGVAFNSCCIDGRIDAAILVSGLELPFPGGDYENRPATPVLVIHGGRDSSVPVANGDGLFASAKPPAYYLRFRDADHSSMLIPERPGYRQDMAQLADSTVVAFLDAYLRGDPERLHALPSLIRESGLATLQTRTS